MKESQSTNLKNNEKSQNQFSRYQIIFLRGLLGGFGNSVAVTGYFSESPRNLIQFNLST